MVKRKEKRKVVKVFNKRMTDKGKKTTVLFALILVVSLLTITSSGNLFATYGYGEDWSGSIGIEGAYLPHAYTTKTFFASSDGDNFEIDFDGPGLGFGYRAALGGGAGFTTGATRIGIRDDVNRIYQDNIYSRWGEEGYFVPEDYSDLNGWYSLYPNFDMELRRLMLITDDSTPTLVKQVLQNEPSAVGTDSQGNYYEEFFYRFELNVKIHADEIKLEGGLGSFDWSYERPYGQAVATTSKMYEFANVEDLYVIFGVDTDATNISIVNVIRDIQTFGQFDVKFYEYDSNFIREVSRATVDSEMKGEGWPSSIPFVQSVLSDTFINRNYLMSGTDPTTGLSVVDSDLTPELNDPDKMYFAFAFDDVGIPAYYYTLINYGIYYADVFKLWDLQITVPMMLSITTNYDIDTGNPNLRIGNNDGTEILVTNHDFSNVEDENENVYLLQVSEALNIPYELALPVVLVIAFIVYIKFIK